MIRVYAPHGTFEFDADEFAWLAGEDLEIRKGEEVIATFNTGQWNHVEQVEGEVGAEESSPEPRVWDSTRSIPEGVEVTDKDGDYFGRKDGSLYYIGTDRCIGYGVNPAWAENDQLDEDLRPFTEVV